MYIYSEKQKASIDRATAKAKEVKPASKAVGYGKFQVIGSQGDSYQVSFTKTEFNELAVICECRANSKRALPCYHAAAVSSIFKKMAHDRAAAPDAPGRLYCAKCGWRYSTGQDGLCEPCRLEAFISTPVKVAALADDLWSDEDEAELIALLDGGQGEPQPGAVDIVPGQVSYEPEPIEVLLEPEPIDALIADITRPLPPEFIAEITQGITSEQVHELTRELTDDEIAALTNELFGL